MLSIDKGRRKEHIIFIYVFPWCNVFLFKKTRLFIETRLATEAIKAKQGAHPKTDPGEHERSKKCGEPVRSKKYEG